MVKGPQYDSLRTIALVAFVFLCGVFIFSSMNISNNANKATVIGQDTTAPTTPVSMTVGPLIYSGQTIPNQLVLSWTAATDDVGVAGYDVAITGPTGSQYANALIPIGGGTTEFTLTNCQPGTPYTFKVRARDAAGNLGVFSTQTTVTTNNQGSVIAPTQGTVTTGTTMAAITADQTSFTQGTPVTFSVTPASGVALSKIEIYRAFKSYGSYMVGSDTSAPFSFTWSDTTKFGAGTYYVKAKIYPTTGTPSFTDPIAVTLLSGTATTTGTTTGGSGSTGTTGGTGGITTSGTTTLGPGVIGGNATGGTTAGDSNPDSTPSEAPSSIQAVGYNTMSITWKKSTSTDVVEQLIRISGDPDVTQPYHDVVMPAIAPTATSVVISGCNPLLAYTVEIRAVDAAGNMSQARRATVNSATPPIADTTGPVLTNISSATASSTSALVNWSTNESADSVVEYGTTTSYGNRAGTGIDFARDHSVTLSNLESGKTYHYRIRARDFDNSTLVLSGDKTFVVGGGTQAFSISATNTSGAPIASGAAMSGTIQFSVSAPANTDHIEWYRSFGGGAPYLVGYDWGAPFTGSWNTVGFTNQVYQQTAKAYDANGAFIGTSTNFAINVQN